MFQSVALVFLLLVGGASSKPPQGVGYPLGMPKAAKECMDECPCRKEVDGPDCRAECHWNCLSQDEQAVVSLEFLMEFGEDIGEIGVKEAVKMWSAVHMPDGPPEHGPQHEMTEGHPSGHPEPERSEAHPDGEHNPGGPPHGPIDGEWNDMIHGSRGAKPDGDGPTDTEGNSANKNSKGKFKIIRLMRSDQRGN